MYKAVIFDMDGTILDTISDLTDSINYALKEIGEKHNLSEDMVKLCFGCGIRADMEKSLALARGCPGEDLEFVGNSIPLFSYHFNEEDVKRLESLFNPYYSSHCRIHTGPYEGIINVLKTLKAHGICTAVASNKNEKDVKLLAENLFPHLFDEVIGNGPELPRKPAPHMIHRILEELSLSPEESVYVGDSEVDIETAKNAGIPCISVSWGFRTVPFLKAHGASFIVHDRGELLASLMK